MVPNPQPSEAIEIIRDFVDPYPCSFDHHGFCQEHGWTATKPACPHARAKEFLAREVPSDQT